MQSVPLEHLHPTGLPEPDDDLDALAFAAIVREASDEALEELMTADEEEREQILDGIFARVPKRLRPGVPRDLRAVVHWLVSGRPAGREDVYELEITGGACRVAKPPVREPDATVRVGATAFLRLVSGAADARLLVATDRLTLEGDEELALYVESLFERP